MTRTVGPVHTLPAARRRGRPPWLRTAAVAVLLAVVTACGADAGGAPDDAGGVTPGVDGAGAADADADAVYGGFPIAPPAPDEVVLTLVGATTVELTMERLEALATREVTFLEPFVKVEQTFRVVALAELLPLAGIAADATVDTIALNDYRYRDGVGALLDADALLAVARDGAPIPMNNGGPIRLVFAADSAYHTFLDAWNWSLRSIVTVPNG